MDHENCRVIYNVVCRILTFKSLKILNVVKCLLKQKVSLTEMSSNMRLEKWFLPDIFWTECWNASDISALISVQSFIFKVPLPALTHLFTVSSNLLSTPSWPLHIKEMKDFPSLDHCPNYRSLSCMSYWYTLHSPLGEPVDKLSPFSTALGSVG